MDSHGPTYSTGLHLQWAPILLLSLASHRAPVCYERRMFYVNRFPRESLIINADSSEGRNPWHLAARTANENVIREVNLRARKKGSVGFLFLYSCLLHLWTPGYISLKSIFLGTKSWFYLEVGSSFWPTGHI